MVTIKGIDKLVVKLDKLSDLDLTESLNKACLVVENTAKEDCPKDTGNLSRSITHEVVGNEGIIGTNVEYAPYVEFGTGLYASAGDGRKTKWRYKSADGSWHTTSGQKPQPFLQPALLKNKDEVIQILKDGVKEAMK